MTKIKKTIIAASAAFFVTFGVHADGSSGPVEEPADSVLTEMGTSNEVYVRNAAGYGYGSSLNYAGSIGSYWSSTPNSDDSDNAWSLNFDSSYFYRDYNLRYYGQSVRPVRDAK